MTIYTGPVFEMARTQFEIIADHLEIPRKERARLLYPKRAVAVSIPVNMDDGRTEVFQGYRVQHHLTLGPTKGGTRFSPGLDVGEVAALAIWMSWKCALAGLPYGGAKGGVACDPPALSRRELEAVSRRYMQEMIPFVSPQTDVMAPDMGTNEQVMAWFMDTYSMHEGHSVNEIVTGKPVALGGTLGRREATGRGVAYLANRACETIGLPTEGARAIVQGFGNVGSVSAYSLARRYGMRITGVSDHTAAYHDSAGLPLDAIVPNPRQPRSVFDGDALEELVESIREVGLLQPVVVRPLGDDRYEIVMGERRWRASQAAGTGTIPAIVRPTEDLIVGWQALRSCVQSRQFNVSRSFPQPVQAQVRGSRASERDHDRYHAAAAPDSDCICVDYLKRLQRLR